MVTGAGLVPGTGEKHPHMLAGLEVAEIDQEPQYSNTAANKKRREEQCWMWQAR
jgi:hypothetical protein